MTLKWDPVCGPQKETRNETSLGTHFSPGPKNGPKSYNQRSRSKDTEIGENALDEGITAVLQNELDGIVPQGCNVRVEEKTVAGFPQELPDSSSLIKRLRINCIYFVCLQRNKKSHCFFDVNYDNPSFFFFFAEDTKCSSVTISGRG